MRLKHSHQAVAGKRTTRCGDGRADLRRMVRVVVDYGDVFDTTDFLEAAAHTMKACQAFLYGFEWRIDVHCGHHCTQRVTHVVQSGHTQRHHTTFFVAIGDHELAAASTHLDFGRAEACLPAVDAVRYHSCRMLFGQSLR